MSLFIFIWWISYYSVLYLLNKYSISVTIINIYSLLFILLLFFVLIKQKKLDVYGIKKINSNFKLENIKTNFVLLLFPICNIVLHILQANTIIDFSISRVLLILFASIIEEIIYRSFLINFIKRNIIKNDAVAVLLAALIFSLSHIENTSISNLYLISQIICSFCVGTCFGAIFLNIESIYPLIFIHFLINISGDMLNTDISMTEFVVYIVIGTLYLLTSIYYLKKSKERRIY